MSTLGIIIPYFKLKFFRETLSSLAAQTDQRFMVYIGNDASPENPDELLKEFNGKFNFRYQNFKTNLGGNHLTKQWDRCLHMVTDEEWFMILGDDDTLSENAIKEFHNAIDSNNKINLYRFSTQIIDENSKVISPVYTYNDLELSTEFTYKRSKNEVRSSLGEFIFKYSHYKMHGIEEYPKAFYSDNWMVLWYSNFGPIKNIDNATAYIRISKESLSGNTANKDDLKKAGWLFYRDLLVNNSKHFTRKQKSMFLNILISGLESADFKISYYDFFKLCLKNVGLKKTARKVITVLKMHYD